MAEAGETRKPVDRWCCCTLMSQVQRQYIIVLGRSDPAHRSARVKRALEEFRRAPFEFVDPATEERVPLKILLFSGGSPKTRTPEALLMMEFAAQHGVDRKFMRAESTSRTTVENLLNCSALLQSWYPSAPAYLRPRLTICTSSFHIKRAVVLSRMILHGYELDFIHTREPVSLEMQEHEWRLLRAFLEPLTEAELETPVQYEACAGAGAAAGAEAGTEAGAGAGAGAVASAAESGDGSSFVFYLHPAQGTPLCERLAAFWAASERICGKQGRSQRNDALKYPFHVALTSFFTLDGERAVAEVIRLGEQAFSAVARHPVLEAKPYRVPGTEPPCDYNTSGIALQAPDVSRAIGALIRSGTRYGLQSTVADGLHLTLYRHVSHSTMVSLEDSLLAAVRSALWEDVVIILWRTDRSCMTWKQVHVLKVAASATPVRRCYGYFVPDQRTQLKLQEYGFDLRAPKSSFCAELPPLERNTTFGGAHVSILRRREYHPNLVRVLQQIAEEVRTDQPWKLPKVELFHGPYQSTICFSCPILTRAATIAERLGWPRVIKEGYHLGFYSSTLHSRQTPGQIDAMVACLAQARWGFILTIEDCIGSNEFKFDWGTFVPI